MDPTGFALAVTMTAAGIMAIFTVTVNVLKQYAEKNRLEIKTCHAVVLTIAEGEKCQERIQLKQKHFLEYFEYYTRTEIMALRAAASAAAINFAILLSVIYFFDGSDWSNSNLITVLLNDIVMLSYGVYNYRKYRQLKKLSK